MGNYGLSLQFFDTCSLDKNNGISTSFVVVNPYKKALKAKIRNQTGNQIELIEARHRLGVYEAMPGITGYAQVRGIDMSVPQVLAEADQVYLKEQSLMGDFGLLFQTLVGRGSGDKTS